ncbi:hypothetical protein ACJX0J_008559, partial [Zea mays]
MFNFSDNRIMYIELKCFRCFNIEILSLHNTNKFLTVCKELGLILVILNAGKIENYIGKIAVSIFVLHFPQIFCLFSKWALPLCPEYILHSYSEYISRHRVESHTKHYVYFVYLDILYRLDLFFI